MGLLHRDREDHATDRVRSSAHDDSVVDVRDADRPGHVHRDGEATVVAPRAGDDTGTVARDGNARTAVVDRTEVVEERHDDHVRPDEDMTVPTLVRERTWTFAPGQLVSMVVGGALVIVGTLALLRAGLSEPLDDPVVRVLGLDHTAWLGLGEVALGLLLMLVGSGAWGRPLSILLGAAMVVAGVLVVAESGAMPDELALERDFGWLLIPLGALVALAAMALPVWRNTHTNVRTLDLRDHDRDHEERTERRRFWQRR
ncbi:MAG: hypothetical protein ACO1PW_11775 [Actinomycetota bacterium]